MSGCFKEQRYKINASNSQHAKLRVVKDDGCFKEQRYKINASNSQQCSKPHFGVVGLFQRAKIQDKCKQFTTRNLMAVAGSKVVSKSKDTR